MHRPLEIKTTSPSLSIEKSRWWMVFTLMLVAW